MSTLHYFPPNPEKIGDNLLTWDIAYQESQNVDSLIYYASPVVAEILDRFSIPAIQYKVVASMEQSFILAQGIRTEQRTIDLQQLNCYIDYPDFRHLFDSYIHPWAKKQWDMQKVKTHHGLSGFSCILRAMVGLDYKALRKPRMKASFDRTRNILLFPQCNTGLQNLSGWAGAAEILMQFGRAIVIGMGDIRRMELWPRGLEFRTDLSGGDLVDIISESWMCIGGANGLSHLAAELDKPLLMIWGYNDRHIFGPVGDEETIHVDLNDMSSMGLSAITQEFALRQDIVHNRVE